jgi:transcriptional regulator with XRE-family HTH domain
VAWEELKKLGQRVREIRLSQQLTQERVADQSGLHITYIAGIEGGYRNPSFLSLEALAKVLNVSLAELAEGLGPKC